LPDGTGSPTDGAGALADPTRRTGIRDARGLPGQARPASCEGDPRARPRGRATEKSRADARTGQNSCNSATWSGQVSGAGFRASTRRDCAINPALISIMQEQTIHRSIAVAGRRPRRKAGRTSDSEWG